MSFLWVSVRQQVVSGGVPTSTSAPLLTEAPAPTYDRPSSGFPLVKAAPLIVAAM